MKMKNGILLSKAEMRGILGGSEETDTLENGQCLYCASENYYSCWYRSSTTGNAVDECKRIYPNEQNVDGVYSGCFSSCTMH